MFDFDPKSDARNVGPEILFPSGIRFQLVETADSSLTAQLIYSTSATSETMHSLRGAFLETVYIYGTAYDTAVRLLDQAAVHAATPPLTRHPRVFSLGLGLGYVELLSSALSIRHNRELRGASFEAVPELNSSFLHWLEVDDAGAESIAISGLDSGIVSGVVPAHVYDDILSRTAKETGVDATSIKSRLRDAIQSRAWLIEGPLTAALVNDGDKASAAPAASPATTSADSDSPLATPFHCIAFDAFSSKSTPELWTREFLESFLAKACAPVCALSTYACTGHLKRALQAAGFALNIREGYASKRDSTLATRSIT